MITILAALVSLLSFRVRSRAYLELELIALRHQVSVLRQTRAIVDIAKPLGVAVHEYWADLITPISNVPLPRPLQPTLQRRPLGR
jgi:hypothetical protein